MPVFTAAATALLSGTFLASSAIATSILASGLATVAGNVLGVFDDGGGGAASVVDDGVDVRLAPSTTNRIPVLYGKFQQRGIVNYFEVSEDRQKLYAVVVLGEGPVSSIDSIYWEDLLLTLDENGVVTDATDLDGESVDRLNGHVTIMTYPSGGRSTFLETNSTLWTSSHTMTNIAYVVVEATYDREDGVTGIPDVRFRGTAPISNPAEAVEDMFTNTTYGLGLDASFIDTASITAATSYFDELVDYVDAGGVDRQQKRSEVNGVLNTGDSVFDRVETILTGCNASLRWADGKWGIFLNKVDSVETFNVNVDNIIGSISVTETGLNNLYNAVEVQYGRDVTNNYQRGTVLRQTPAAVRYPSEIDRKLTISLPLVHNSVEAAAVATVILNQGRQQLTVRHRLDATGMPLEAGDVVSYTDEDYGWANKPFRIISTTEVNDGGILAYDIEAIEYADEVYDYGVLNETDVAPNVPPNDSVAVQAVDDLNITGSFRAAATPYIALQWTVPDNSLIESFTVFYNITNTTFNSGNTKVGGVEQIPNGNYSAGEIVSHQLVGVPAGDVSIWVVGNNAFVSSSESNRAALDGWLPTGPAAPVFDRFTRYNATPSVVEGVDIDVGAPPANATGTGTGRNNDTNDTGWYIFDPEAADRDNAPVWTATTEVQREDALSRVINFTFSGDAATQETVFTDVNQITDFAFTGTVGEREFFYNARPEITDFTLTGQGADYDVDVNAQWSITTSGSSDATGPDTNDVFYIAPRGTSNTFTGETFSFTPSGFTGDGSTSTETLATAFTYQTVFSGEDSTVHYIADNGGGNSLIRVDYSTADITTAIATMNSLFGTSFVEGTTSTETVINQGVDYSIVVNGTAVVTQTDIVSIIYNANGRNFNVSCSIADTTGTEPVNNTSIDIIATVGAIQSAVTITLDSTSIEYVLANNIVGAIGIGSALNTAIGDDFAAGFTKTFVASTGVITFTANDIDAHTSSVSVIQGTNGSIAIAPSSTPQSGTPTDIQLMVTTESIDETIELSSNISGSALRTEVFNKFNAITSITDEFTLALITIDIDGTDTEVVRFTANDFVDHVFMVTVNSGITGTTSGTIVDGAEATTPTSIRITYDDGITPSFQDITFANADANQLAADLVTLIDSHGELTASVSENVVTITHDNPGPVDEPVVSITTQGTGDAAFAVATITDGVAAAGTPTSYAISYPNITTVTGNFSTAADEDTMASELRLAINAISTHTASVTDNVVTATSVANDGSDLTVVVTQGTNKPSGVSTNDAVVARAVTRLGSPIDVFGGVDASVTVQLGGSTYYTNTYGGDTLVELTLDVVNGINTDNSDFTNHFTSAVKAGDGNELRATADFVGISPIMTITVTTGSTATVDAIGNVTTLLANLAVSRTVIENGQTNPVVNGTLSTFSVVQGAATIIAATDLASGLTTSQVSSFITNSLAANLQSLYTTTLDGTVLTATSEFKDDNPDLTITITPGTNADASAGDLAVVKLVTQEGSSGDTDLSTAIWEYAITSPTADDDLLMVDPDTGVLTVRRGLVLDTTELQETSPGYDEVRVISSTQHVVGNKDSTLIMTGLAALPAISTSVLDGANSVGYSLAYTTNDPPVDDSFTAVTTYLATQTNPLLGVGLYSPGFQSGSSIPDDTWAVQGDGSVTFRGTTFQSDTLAAYIGLVTDGQPNTLAVPVTITITNMTNASSVITVSNVVAGSHVSGGSQLRLFSETGSTAVVTATGTFDANDVVEFSVSRSDSSTWVDIDSLSFNTAFPAAYADQLVPVPLGISAAFDADKDLTYSFRLVRTGDDALGGFSWNMLIIEELRT